MRPQENFLRTAEKKEYMKRIIFTDRATSPTSLYSQAVQVGRVVYLAGVCGDDPATGKIMGNGDMLVEARYALENLKHTVEAAGGTMNDLVKVQVYVNDLDHLPAFNQVYGTYFKDGYLPARIAMQVVKFAGGANLEMDAIAVLD